MDRAELFLAMPKADGVNADAEARRRLKATVENFIVTLKRMFPI